MFVALVPLPVGLTDVTSPLESSELHAVVRSVAAAILRLRGDHPDVQDCINETLRRAVEHQDRLRPGEPLRPWIVGIARHVALDVLRNRRHKSALFESRPKGDSSSAEQLPMDRVPDPSPGPDELLERGRQRALLRQALLELPEATRSALVLFHVEGKSYQQIARELNVPLGTVATWVTRGRKALVEKLFAKGSME